MTPNQRSTRRIIVFKISLGWTDGFLFVQNKPSSFRIYMDYSTDLQVVFSCTGKPILSMRATMTLLMPAGTPRKCWVFLKANKLEKARN